MATFPLPGPQIPSTGITRFHPKLSINKNSLLGAKTVSLSIDAAYPEQSAVTHRPPGFIDVYS